MRSSAGSSPPVIPGSTSLVYQSPALIGPEPRLAAGLYAVSAASLVRGLPWRVYDPGDPPQTWSPAWNAQWDRQDSGAFSYFAELTPFAKVGYSIFLYDVTPEQCARINARLVTPPAPLPPR